MNTLIDKEPYYKTMMLSTKREKEKLKELADHLNISYSAALRKSFLMLYNETFKGEK